MKGLYDDIPDYIPPAASIERRLYQEEAVAALRSLAEKGMRKILLQASTGAGKTVCACMIMEGAVKKGKRCLFLAPSRELIDQCSRKLEEFGLPHGIIMSGRGYNLDRPIQVASKDTLLVRAFRNKTLSLPPADLVIPDEAHLTMSKWWLYLLNQYPRAIVLGLTATPCRRDGKGLGSFYKGMVSAAPTSRLIAEGFLVPFHCYSVRPPSLKGVKRKKGDFVPTQLEERLNRHRLVGDIVSHWLRHGEGRQTIVRATGIAHSMSIRDQFLAAGVSCEHLDGETDTQVRDAIIKRFKFAETRVLTQCAVINMGFDAPIAGCFIDADPTLSFGKLVQGAGRVMRPYPGKKYAVYLDHAGNLRRHNFVPDEDVDWKLAKNEKAFKPKEPNKPPTMQCPSCKALIRPAPVCPNCGYAFGRKVTESREVEVEDGLLVEMTAEQKQAVSFEQKVRKWHAFLGFTANRGQGVGFAASLFSKEFGMAPWDVPGLPNVPGREPNLWRMKTADLYPQYLRGNNKVVQEEVSPCS